MKTDTVHWEKKRAEDPLTLMKRGDLKRLCSERGVPFDHATTSARELRILLRKSGYGDENATQ